MPRKKKKTAINITIDDAGSGNFAGGMIIAAYAEEITSYTSSVIQPDEYNDTTIEMQKKVFDAVDMLLSTYSDYDIESVFLCQSNLFDITTYQLIDRGYVVIRGRVEGELQNIIEDDFIKHLQSFGMPEYLKFYLKMIERDKNLGYRLLNNFCINFVKVDMPNRLKFCKSHNKLYEDLQKTAIDIEKTENKFMKKPKLCCECGRYVYDNILYKFTTVGFNSVFYGHCSCIDKITSVQK